MAVNQTQPKPKTQVATKTGISQALAYGVVAFSALAGLAFFWTSAAAYSKELDTSLPLMISRPSMQELTTTVLKNGANASQAVADRQVKLKKLFRTDPDTASRFVLNAATRGQLTSNLQASVEQEVSLSGTVRQRVADNADGTSEDIHQLKTANGQTYRLFYTSDVNPPKTGQSLEVASAYLIGDEALVPGTSSSGADNLTVSGEAVAATSHKTAFILFNFQNSQRQPMTTDQVRQVVFTNSTSISNYYLESSSNTVNLVGKLRPDGDVFGWYTIPMNEPAVPADCNGVDAWASYAEGLAARDGFTASGYQHYVYVMPWLTSEFAVCGWAGLSDINGTQSWINGAPNYVNIRVTGHEIGHNFGLGHANAYRCRDASGQPVALSTSCTNLTYSDPFDVMGNFTYPNRHFSNYRKAYLGWYPAGSVVDVTANGTYTLTPMEQASGGTKALRIARPGAGGNMQYFYVEFRQPSGTFDNFSTSDPAVNGVSIRLGPSTGTAGGQSALIDATPATVTDGANGFLDAALASGQTFQDFQKGITIRTESVSAQGASVTVSFVAPTCQHVAPIVNINPSTQTGAAGGSKTYAVMVSSLEDSACPSATYTLSSVLPTGWVQTSAPATLTVLPGQSASFAVTMTPLTGTPPGFYEFTETVTNTVLSGYGVTKTGSLTIVQSETTAPTVSIASPANGSKLPGKGKVNVNATASDASGIASLSIKIDNLYVKTCTNVTSCTYGWNMSKLAAGSHTITAIATDKSPAGNQSTTSITVTK